VHVDDHALQRPLGLELAELPVDVVGDVPTEVLDAHVAKPLRRLFATLASPSPSVRFFISVLGRIEPDRVRVETRDEPGDRVAR
jgi:hypothetical protein